MQLRDDCGAKFGLSDGWTDASDVMRKRLYGIENRSSQWKADRADQHAMEELTQALRGMAGELAEKAAKAALREI
jgi:hypothetical protein